MINRHAKSVAILGLAAILCCTGSIWAKDFRVTVNGEPQYFDLDKTRIALGFATVLSPSAQSAILERYSLIGQPAIERIEPTIGSTLVHLKNGLSETQVESAISELEALPEVAWAAPVLIYDGLEHVPGPQLFVQLDEAMPLQRIHELCAANGLVIKTPDRPLAGNQFWLQRPKLGGWNVLDLCEQLTSEPGVLWAEPDFIRQARLHTNDTFYANQWFLNQGSDADIDAPEAWTITTGSTAITVSICDVGVQITHPDLNDKIEIGYDSEVADNNPSPTGDDPHGTNCAGLAAAETNNSLGVAGVGYNVRLLGAKMGHSSGGFIVTTDAQIVNCINYSRDSADVMSNSWGGGASSGAINTALTNARNAGLVVLFSSGNSNGAVQYPATQSSVIAVGATNQNDDRCTPIDWGGGQGSCFGSQLDVTAPGNAQYTTDLTGGQGYSGTDYYSDFGGTSGACPVAAGVCALILSVDPSLTVPQVQTVLQNTANDLVGAPAEDVAGWDQYMGYGRVNANGAVRYVFGVPLNLLATSGLSNVPLSWTVPWRTPNSYDIYRSTTGSGGTYSLLGNSVTTSYNDNAVTGGLTYWYKIKAVYTNGQSDYSNIVSATPVTSYNPPQNLIAEGGQNNQVPVYWMAPVSGTPLRYDVYRATSELGSYSLLGFVNHPTLIYTDFTALNGTIYWYKAKAVYTGPNESVFSNADSALPVAPPNTPPTLYHNPLDDNALGSGTVTALANDNGSVTSVKMFHRLVGAGSFDSTTLAPTGNAQEYSASLAALATGAYEYYLRAVDNLGAVTVAPVGAPTTLLSIDVWEHGITEISYDDGTSELYNYANDFTGIGTQWAVKFGPVATPYILCGARFAVARTKPDTAHSPIYFAIYLADGPGGKPGTLLQDGVNGTIGNDIGGIPVGTAWAQINVRDDLGMPLQINASEFYIALANEIPTKIEAFSHDTGGLNNHRSYFYSPCDDDWFSEDAIHDMARPGNRLIRAQGFSLTAPTIVISKSGNDVRLDWPATGASQFNVYSSAVATGPFTTFEGTTSTNSFIDVGPFGVGIMRYYQVKVVVN